ncbi:MAG: hypothetical protein HYX94_11165 [Chloroflexi bacterium]|nr:hypothetical protein [Chloroflexota bacterium]
MRRITILGGILVLLLLVLAGGAGLRQTTAAPDDVVVTVTGTAARAIIQYDITISNKGTAAISDIYVAGLISSGAKFDSVVTTPAGATSLGAQGNVVAWLLNRVPAGGSATLSYKLNAPDGSAPVNAYVAWKAPTAGSASSAAITRELAVDNGAAKRGCMACHYSVTLARESERGGPNHPKIANEATVDVCLGCHKAAADRTGLAPKMLRTIVHAAHLNSDSFITRYKGNCFTCHEISETGAWLLLYDKVHGNQYNVPAAESINAKGYASSGRPIIDVKP